jgi:hypothetical protein
MPCAGPVLEALVVVTPRYGLAFGVMLLVAAQTQALRPGDRRRNVDRLRPAVGGFERLDAKHGPAAPLGRRANCGCRAMAAAFPVVRRDFRPPT